MKHKKSLLSQLFSLGLWSIGRRRCRLVRQFGQARLIRLPNGQHELIGGTDADRAAAYEWSSLFAHEIVFTHFHREAEPVIRRVALRPQLEKWWPLAWRPVRHAPM